MKEKIMTVIKSKLLFAVAVNAVFAVFIVVLTAFSYVNTDDFYYSTLICKQHFYYSSGINYILAAIVGTVQYSLPDFNCFVLVEIISSFSAFVSITFVFADKYNNRKALIFTALLNIIYALNHYSSVESSNTSALLLLGGFMLILNAIYNKRYSLSCWVGVVEIIFGSFYNYIYFYVALLFAVAFFFGDMLAKRKYRLPFRKFFWYSRPFLLMYIFVTLLVIGLNQFSFSVNHATPEAQSYYEYSVAKKSVDALPFPNYKNYSKELAKAGIDSEIKYEMLKNGYYDPEHSLDTNALIEVNKIQLEEIKDQPTYALNTLFRDFLNHIEKFDASFFAMVVYLGVSVVFIIYHKNRFSFFPLFYFIAGLATCVILRLFFFKNEAMLYGAVMYMLALLMNSFNFEIQRSKKPSSKLRLRNGYMILSSIAVLIIGAFNGVMFFSNSDNSSGGDTAEALLSDINRNPDCYYVFDSGSVEEFYKSTENYIHPLWGFRSEYLDNVDSFGYFHNDEILRRRYLPENIYEAVLTNRKIYAVDKNIVFKKEQYLTQNYADKNQFVTYEQVNELNGFKIYEVKYNDF